MAKKSNSGNKVQKSIDKAKYRNSLVVVHGVGKQKAFAVVESFTSCVEKSLDQFEVKHQRGKSETVAEGVNLQELEISTSKPSAIIEVHWADIVEQEREKGIGAAVRRSGRLLVALPILIMLAVMPRYHEDFTSGTYSKEAAQKTSKKGSGALTEMLALAPTVWRMATWFTILLILSLGLTAYLWPTVAILVALAVGVLLYAQSRFDVFEHLAIASKGGRALDAVNVRTNNALSYASENSEHVWVIGHSQGGYITHQLLSTLPDGRYPKVRKYTGLASGLKPISVLREVSNRQWIIYAWANVLSNALIVGGVVRVFEPGELGNTFGFQIVIYLSTALLFNFPSILMMPDSVSLLTDFVEASSHSVWPDTWYGPLLIFVGLVSAFFGWRYQRSRNLVFPKLRPLRSKIEWHEISSLSDIVGSMSVPELPSGVIQGSVPTRRSPIFDHPIASYLNTRSVFRFEICKWAYPNLKRTGMYGRIDRLGDRLEFLSLRIYRLRMTIYFMFLSIAVLVPSILGKSLYSAASNALWTGVLVYSLALAFGGIWWWIGSRFEYRELFGPEFPKWLSIGVDSLTTNYDFKFIRSVLLAGVVSLFGFIGYALFSVVSGSELNRLPVLFVSVMNLFGIVMLGAMVLILLSVVLSVCAVSFVRVPLILALMGCIGFMVSVCLKVGVLPLLFLPGFFPLLVLVGFVGYSLFTYETLDA